MVVKSYQITTEDLAKLDPKDLYDLHLMMMDGVFTYLKDVTMINCPQGQVNVAGCQKRFYKQLDICGRAKNFARRKAKHQLPKVTGIFYIFKEKGFSFKCDEIKWETSNLERVGPMAVLKLASAITKGILRCFGSTLPLLADDNQDDKDIDKIFGKFYSLLKLVPERREYSVCENTELLSILLKIDTGDEV